VLASLPAFETGAGKTATRHCLIEALRVLNVDVEEQLLFPATLTLPELLGDSHGSKDAYGLLGRVMRSWLKKQLVIGELSEWPGTALVAMDPGSPAALRGRLYMGSRDGPEDAEAGSSPEELSPAMLGGMAVEVSGKSFAVGGERSVNPLSAFVGFGRLDGKDECIVGARKSTPLLVLDGPLAGGMPGMLLPLLTGGQLCHSGEGGSLHSVEGLQVRLSSSSSS
jgi:hypothetical protein